MTAPQLTANEVEEWRPVPGGLPYEVSSFGRLRSLPRTVVRSNGAPQRVAGRVLRLNPNEAGHLTASFSVLGERRGVKVHWVVAEAFHGPRPAGMEIRHLDGDPTNNRAVNLRYGTRSENCQDRVWHGTHTNAAKTHCPAGHPYDEVNTIRRGRGRWCRTCKRAHGREYMRRKRARNRGGS